MRKRLFLMKVAVFIFLCPAMAFGHHAREYVEVESYETISKGDFTTLLNWDYFSPHSDSSDSHWEITPTLLYGITDRLMADIHTHISKFHGQSLFVEAIAGGLQYKLTEQWPFGLDIGCLVEYEYPTDRSRHTADKEDELDGVDVLMGTLIVSREWPHDINTVLNLSYEKEMKYGHDSTTSYGFGIKTHLIPSIETLEMGVEFVGTLGANKECRIIPGAYMNVGKLGILKIGTGFGLTNHSDDYSYHLHWVFNF